jgi:hypothetical protein
MKQRVEALVVFLTALTLVIIMAAALALAKDKFPPAKGQAFWTYIHKTDPYTKWAMWPGHEGLHEGKSPHGNYVRVFVNKLALQAAKTGKPMPFGAIIIKENYKDKKTLLSLTPMYKVKGYNPAGGDWYWTKISPNGKILAEGKLKGCLRCHEAVKSNDWVFHD